MTNYVCMCKNITDLGILLDHKPAFTEHVCINGGEQSKWCLRIYKALAKGIYCSLRNDTIYINLVLLILGYRSIIWRPHFLIYVNLIESVQKRFLLFCLRGLGWNSFVLPSFESRLTLIKLPTLQCRRIMLSLF